MTNRAERDADHRAGPAGQHGEGLSFDYMIDPRLGDVEDDASSTKQRSMLGLAGSLLAEVSLPKLFIAWVLLIVLPGVLFGLAPLLVSIWLSTLSRTMTADVGWIIFAILLVPIVAIGLFAGRRLFQIAEGAFWGLNSLAIQPAYALVREGIRHFTAKRGGKRHPRFHAAAALIAGFAICALGLLVAALVWPGTRWVGTFADLAAPSQLVLAAVANTIFAIGVYVAVAGPIWGIADASMGAPRDLTGFDPDVEGRPKWRVAHLSDIHIVGERYGFRVESGRAGPRGNERLETLLAKLDAIDAERPLDLILITGDATDAGRSAEWAEFFAALARHPAAGRTDPAPSRQPRSQRRRPRQPGPPRASHQPRQASPPDAHPVGDRRRAGRPGSGRQQVVTTTWRYALRRACGRA